MTPRLRGRLFYLAAAAFILFYAWTLRDHLRKTPPGLRVQKTLPAGQEPQAALAMTPEQSAALQKMIGQLAPQTTQETELTYKPGEEESR